MSNVDIILWVWKALNQCLLRGYICRYILEKPINLVIKCSWWSFIKVLKALQLSPSSTELLSSQALSLFTLGLSWVFTKGQWMLLSKSISQSWHKQPHSFPRSLGFMVTHFSLPPHPPPPSCLPEIRLTKWDFELLTCLQFLADCAMFRNR